VTDQTSAHDALGGYVPPEMTLADALVLRRTQPDGVRAPRARGDGRARPGDALLPGRGAVVFDYGNNIRAQAARTPAWERLRLPGFVPLFIRPLFCEGRGPFRWAALSGDPEDIYRTDEASCELFPDDAGLRRWLDMAREKVPFQGLPARICWLGYGERARAGLAFNELVRPAR
jgi:urocanate hydratase